MADPVSEQQLKLRRIAAFIETYDGKLDALELPPNGDDYNEIMDGLRSILAGGMVPEVKVSEEGR